MVATGSLGSQPQGVVLRDLSKGIFLYPLAIYSLISAIIEYFGEKSSNPADILPSEAWIHSNVLSLIWVVMFFANIFVVSFDVSTGKFLILILAITLIGLIVVFLIHYEIIQIGSIGNLFNFNLEIRTHFYLMTALILGVIVLLTLVAGLFRYVRIEANEVLVKGILGDVKRFPTTKLHYDKKIIDVFEFMALRAGTIILHILGAGEPVELHTVPNVNKKAEQMDALLSVLKISL
ncbi:MAG: hypothetical protein RBG13Loki_1012 [Promethearchaeota archaeon CR_4]|nr:MAG: hypothetical protein RBG13Loki_1012 [Candidatus Lokiarchaeota archaeon CR_4]